MHYNCFVGICSGPPPGLGGIFNPIHNQFKNINSVKDIQPNSKVRFVKHYNVQETKTGLLKYLSNKRCLTLNEV